MSKKQMFQLGAILVVVLGVFLIAHEAKAPSETTPATSSATNLPQRDSASIGKVIKDPASGKEFMSNEIIVEFQPEISEADSLSIISDAGGKMEKRFTLAPIFLVQVKDPGDGSVTRKVATTLRANQSVKSADLNYLTTLPTPTKTAPK